MEVDKPIGNILIIFYNLSGVELRRQPYPITADDEVYELLKQKEYRDQYTKIRCALAEEQFAEFGVKVRARRINWSRKLRSQFIQEKEIA